MDCGIILFEKECLKGKLGDLLVGKYGIRKKAERKKKTEKKYKLITDILGRSYFCRKKKDK
jgi:hypothetical protein